MGGAVRVEAAVQPAGLCAALFPDEGGEQCKQGEAGYAQQHGADDSFAEGKHGGDDLRITIDPSSPLRGYAEAGEW